MAGVAEIGARPGLWRLLACALYEAVLLFGVVMLAGLLYSGLTDQRHALQGKPGLQAFMFVVLAIYFVWFWSRSGQTLAMKTWHVRLVRSDGRRLTQPRALARYLACWSWFVPALATAYWLDLRSTGAVAAALVIGVLAYGGSSLLRRDRRFWHDVVCDTRLIHWRPVSSAMRPPR